MASSSEVIVAPLEAPREERIRSYVRREGRMTEAQRQALNDLWPRYGIDWSPGAPPVALDRLFGRSAVCHLEIGIGMGDVLFDMARSHPEEDFIGIEVYRPGIGKLLGRLAAHGMENVRIFCADAVMILEQALPAGSLDHVYLLFPDPWPKKRHHKRRIVQPGFAQQVGHCLKPGGTFHLATDWEDYARHMLEVMDAMPGYENLAGHGHYAPRPAYRAISRFECRGTRLGHDCRDLVYRYLI